MDLVRSQSTMKKKKKTCKTKEIHKILLAFFGGIRKFKNMKNFRKVLKRIRKGTKMRFYFRFKKCACVKIILEDFFEKNNSNFLFKLQKPTKK